MSDKPDEWDSARPLEVPSALPHHGSVLVWLELALHMAINLGLLYLMVQASVFLHKQTHDAEAQGLGLIYILLPKAVEFINYILDCLIIVAYNFNYTGRSLKAVRSDASTARDVHLFQQLLQLLAKVHARRGKFVRKLWLSTVLHYTIVTLLGFILGLAFLGWNPFAHQSTLVPEPKQKKPPEKQNPVAPPPVPDHSRRPVSQAPLVQVPPQASKVQTPSLQPEVETPQPPVEQQEATPPVRPRRPIKIPLNVASPKEPPVMEQERPPKPIEPVVPSSVAPEPLSPTYPEPAPAAPEDAQISVGGDIINVFPPTSPTLVTKATFGELPRGSEGHLTGMRLVALVRVDKVGHASVVGDVEFPANFPNSPAMRGRLSSQLKMFVERSVWRAARDDNGVQIAKEINLVVILGRKP